MRLGAAWSATPTFGLGAMQVWSRHVGFAFDVMAATSSADMTLGEVRAVALGLVPAVRLQARGSSYGVYGELGASFAGLRLSGDATDVRLQGSSKVVLWSAGVLRLGVERRVHRHTLGIVASVLYSPSPPEARTRSGQQVVQTVRFASLIPAVLVLWSYDL